MHYGARGSSPVSDAAHSPLGPSSADRWINCPGSVALTRDLPDVDSEYSIEGTAAHNVLEVMRKGLPAPSVTSVKLADKSLCEVVVTEEMVAGAQYYIDHMGELPGLEFNEARVRFDETVPGGFGTLDGAKATETTLYIRDYKFGKGVIVYAEENPQLMLYALGFLETYKILFPSLWKINIGVVQPRLDHIDVYELSLPDLLEWAENVAAPAAKRIMNGTAKVKAGSWCQFCKIKDTCMVRAQTAVASVIGDFSNIGGLTVSSLAPPSAIMTNAQMSVALESVPILKAWIKDLEAGALRKILGGESVGDYKLVEGRSNRGWRLSPEESATRLNKAFGIEPQELYEHRLRSVADIEGRLGKRRFKLVAEELVEKPRGKAVLAPGSDRRAAIGGDVLKEFDVIPEE